MFKKLLEEKSEIKIKNDRWEIDVQFSDYNKCGSWGRDDLIRRHDAVRLLAEMNIKLANVYEKIKRENSQLSEDALNATTVLSYAMWGVRELEPVNNNTTVKIYEILKNENINKIYKDNNGDLWKIKHAPLNDGLVLVMINEGSMRLPITKMYHLDKIFQLDFIEQN